MSNGVTNRKNKNLPDGCDAPPPLPTLPSSPLGHLPKGTDPPEASDWMVACVQIVQSRLSGVLFFYYFFFWLCR